MYIYIYIYIYIHIYLYGCQSHTECFGYSSEERFGVLVRPTETDRQLAPLVAGDLVGLAPLVPRQVTSTTQEVSLRARPSGPRGRDVNEEELCSGFLDFQGAMRKQLDFWTFSTMGSDSF